MRPYTEMYIEKSFELLGRQELLISSEALKKERSTTIWKQSTLKRVEAEETRKGCDIV